MNIRSVRQSDYPQWKPLFEGYCEFYHEAASEEKSRTVFSWLLDENHMMLGLVIEDEHHQIQGLAHYHAWPIPIYGTDACYLSDLFVNPDARGQQIGKKLYQYLLKECASQGWPALVLLTQDDNATARALYDQFGERSDFGFYMTPVQLDE